jgi:hypothetical protein
MQIKCSGTCPAPLERPERALCRDWGEICAATGNSWSRSCISGRYCHISCCARCVTIKDYPSERSWLILCVNFKSVLQFAIDVAIVFVCVSTWKLKKVKSDSCVACQKPCFNCCQNDFLEYWTSSAVQIGYCDAVSVSGEPIFSHDTFLWIHQILAATDERDKDHRKAHIMLF